MIRPLFAAALIIAAFNLAAADLTPSDLFEKPVALTDASGKPLVTGLANGCPFAADFNGDGKIDIILGAHEGMDTGVGGIWLIPNTGSNEKPAFSMSSATRIATADGPLKIGCGCKEAGYVLVQAADWKGDGFTDIVYSDTYQHAFILLNDRKNKEKPSFTQRPLYDTEKTNHGMMGGGGDWDGDGVVDWLYMPFCGNPYKVFRGEKVGGTGLKFTEGGLWKSTVIPIEGDKATMSAWAWDFSATAKARGVTEYVGIQQGSREICLFELEKGKSRKIAVLATAEGTDPMLTIGDLNGDGKMDILYSSGVYNPEKDKTKIMVLYGKVTNIRTAIETAKK
jgi:hypothetical protein